MAQGNNALKWIGIGCGVFFLLGACGVGGVVLYLQTKGDESSGQARGFFADLRSGNYQSALQRTNATYQSTHTLETFQSNVSQIPALTQQTAVSFSSSTMSGTTATHSGNVTTPSGDFPARVTLSKVGDYWYIDSVMVQGQTLQ